jgi:cell division protein FtsB
VRVFKYLAGVWTAVAVYSLLSLFAGSMGLSAHSQLLAERELQWVNMKALSRANQALENEKNSLLYDHDVLAVHARQLGYGREDEQFIRIVGLAGERNAPAAAGQVFFAGSPDSIPDRIIKIIALCAGLSIFALFFIMDLLHSKTD